MSIYNYPRGRSYNYGEYSPLKFETSKRLKPIDIYQVNFENPSNPEDHMYGPQFRTCFVHERKGSCAELLTSSLISMGYNGWTGFRIVGGSKSNLIKFI